MSAQPGSGVWFGEPHTLIVTEVTLPEGQFDDGTMEYEIEHPPTCKMEDRCGYFAYTCDIAFNIDAVGLPFSLRYSGTPITEPGTYRIQGWGRKTYVREAWAYEYDGGIGVMDDA